MAVHKQPKNKRQRAGTTHGYGSMKKNRGAGHRGGRGKAGSGKRGDAKKPSYWKNSKYFGIHGFTPKKNVVNTINVKQIDDNAESWAKQGLITEAAGVYTVDLEKMGYDKLLATGKVNRKLAITVKSATPKAQEKVQTAGGKVELLGGEAPAPKDAE